MPQDLGAEQDVAPPALLPVPGALGLAFIAATADS